MKNGKKVCHLTPFHSVERCLCHLNFKILNTYFTFILIKIYFFVTLNFFPRHYI